MGTGIGKSCKRCGEQLNYDDGFDGGFCNRCSSIVKFERETVVIKMEGEVYTSDDWVQEQTENEAMEEFEEFLEDLVVGESAEECRNIYLDPSDRREILDRVRRLLRISKRDI